MIDDPLFYILAVTAVVIVGISKGGFGGGMGSVAVPLMSLAVSPTIAAAIMLPILCLMDLSALWAWRGRIDTTYLKVLIPAALVGVVLGALSFRYLTEDHIRLMTGAIAVIFALNHWLRRAPTEPKQPSLIRGSFWGALGGFTSFSVHAGGPPLSAYLLPLRLDRRVFVATSVYFFTAVNFAKLLPYISLGLFRTDTLSTSLVLLPLAPAGVMLGSWLTHRIGDKWFYRVCYVALFLTGLKLLWDGLIG
jgi:hypothetical protein